MKADGSFASVLIVQVEPGILFLLFPGMQCVDQCNVKRAGLRGS